MAFTVGDEMCCLNFGFFFLWETKFNFYDFDKFYNNIYCQQIYRILFCFLFGLNQRLKKFFLKKFVEKV